MDEQTLSQLKRKLIHSHTLDNNTSKNNKGFSSIGISNVYERMFMTFGKEFKMDINSELEKGTQVIMSIPKGGRRPNVQSNAS